MLRKLVIPVILVTVFAGAALAVPSDCEECHAKITPNLVADFNRGVMSEDMDCTGCHGDSHKGNDDVDKALLPTIETCAECHEDQASQYLDGKHALGHVALSAMPNTHGQPDPFIAGQKGCGGCHSQGIITQEDRQREERQYYKYGMDCQNCHTRHAFSKKEAQQPEACQTCHMGFDHAQWEMWSGSKHGVTWLMNRAMDEDGDTSRAPTCQDCHMPDGNHRVFSAWGFLAVRLPEEDEEWMGYRVSILKALGVLDPEGQPTDRLEVVKGGKVARLTKESFDAERARFVTICEECHTPNFVAENFKNADAMVKEIDKLFAEAIEIVAGLYQDGVIVYEDRPDAQYPDLLTFYDVDTKVEQTLYEMFMDHRMKAFQATFHMNPDYATWYGYAKLKKDLVEIRELAGHMRADAGK
jgi:hydroxylamine dehydrogenase